jgi:hypothetical protein
MIRKIRGMKEFREQLVRRVLDHFHFLDDHFLLFEQVVFIETRVEQHVGEQIKGARDFRIHDLRGKSGHFVRSVSVEVAAETIRLSRNIVGGTAQRPLEKRMFDKVTDAVLGAGFVSRPAPQPDAETHRAQLRHLLGENCQTIRKTGCLDVVYHFVSRKSIVDGRKPS